MVLSHVHLTHICSFSKREAKIEDKGVQCNTMRSLIKDLKDEIEALQLEIDSTDENINCNIEVSDKVFNTKTSGRCTAYNHKIDKYIIPYVILV